jgi:hypothetical protein
MNIGGRVAVAIGLAIVGAAFFGGSLRRRGASDIVAFAPHPSGQGGWTLDRDGNIFAFGNAPEFREVPEPQPWREGSFVAIASTPTGRGVWTLNSRGNIFAFGDAPEFREIPQPQPWRQGAFTAMASTPTGRGIWVIDRRGPILSYGDAAEFQRHRASRYTA